jgi:NADH-quinone oxidoreductase subunit M
VGGVKVFVLIALLGVLLAAAYILWTVQRVFYGPVQDVFNDVKDADKLQRFYCGLLVVLMFAIGVAPVLLTSVIQNSTQAVAKLIGG